MEDFKSGIEKMILESDDAARRRKAACEEKTGKRNEMLLEFDRFADEIQDQVIAPRVAYLGSRFANAMDMVTREEFEYRHRIHLHFSHTEEFPCIADVTFLVVHCEIQDFMRVKFEYLILPAYVTGNYKFSDSLQVTMDRTSHPAVARFTESCIGVFLAGYLDAKAF